MPEGSYDTLAPADEPPAPSAQVIPPAQNGSNPNAPKVCVCVCVCVLTNLVRVYCTSNITVMAMCIIEDTCTDKFCVKKLVT